MAFFENLGKKVGEAAQAAAKKSSELVEVTKINMNISQEEDKIQKLYTQMGKRIYEGFQASGATDPAFAEDCAAIQAHEETVKSLKQKILEVKNMKACPSCGTELERNIMFCAKCGTKQEVSAAPAPEAVQAGEVQASQFCPSCGTLVSAGTAFCTNCGTKMS